MDYEKLFQEVAVSIKKIYVKKEKAHEVHDNIIKYLNSDVGKSALETKSFDNTLYDINAIITTTTFDKHLYVYKPSGGSVPNEHFYYTPHYISFDSIESIDNINIRRRYMNAFKQLQEPVILDLRFCTGGDANTSFYILCHFFRDGIEMFEMMRRNVEPNIFISASVNTNYDELNVINKYYGKLKVLVNGYSYSASEIIAKTLQVHKRAKVYGSKTPGVTNTCHHVPIEPLMIQMPIAIYVDSITKKPFENIGVFPDYDVTSDEYIKTIYDEVAPNTFKSY